MLATTPSNLETLLCDDDGFLKFPLRILIFL